MTTITHTTTLARYFAVAVASITILALIALPAFASAADYAYVDQVGNVRSTTADTWQAAIATAPNIHTNSGVMLLTAANDDIVGNDVPAY